MAADSSKKGRPGKGRGTERRDAPRRRAAEQGAPKGQRTAWDHEPAGAAGGGKSFGGGGGRKPPAWEQGPDAGAVGGKSFGGGGGRKPPAWEQGPDAGAVGGKSFGSGGGRKPPAWEQGPPSPKAKARGPQGDNREAPAWERLVPKAEPAPRPAPVRLFGEGPTRPFIALVLPGLEGIVGQELRALGGGIGHTRGGRGRVAFDGPADAGLRANLWSRCAERILQPIGEGRAANPSELRRVFAAIPWEEHLPASGPARVHVSTRACRLYHDGVIRDALHEALVARGLRGLEADAPTRPAGVGESRGRMPEDRPAGRWLDEDLDEALRDPDEDHGEQRVEDAPADDHLGPIWLDVRGTEDFFSFSTDLSGRGLHRRGWRRSPGLAPLRETLAAAVIFAAGWRGEVPLLDPMCGSGTFVIEAASLAAGRAPGAHRRFAMERLPYFPTARWKDLLDRAAASERPAPPSPLCFAYDRSRPAADRARRHVETVKLEPWIQVERHRVEELEPRPGPGLTVCNPPWGERLEATDLASTLKALRAARPGHRLVVVHPDVVGRPLLRARHGGTWVQASEVG